MARVADLGFVSQAVLAALIAAIVWTLYRQHSKTRSLDNIPGPPPSGSWVQGHFMKLFARNGWDFHRDINNNYGPVVKLDGPFGANMLFVFDPVALHHITIKDQNVYELASMFTTSNDLIFGKGLLSTLGEPHRRQRKLLNPVFSINHMRHMLPIFYEVTDRLRSAIGKEVAQGPRTMDMLEWMTRVALELVGQGGLGYSLDSLTDATPNAFGTAMKSLGPTILPFFTLQPIIPLLPKLGPARFRRWVLERIPYWRVRKALEIVDSLHTISTEIVNLKKAALERGEEAVAQQVGAGKDIISKLLQANMAASEEDRLPDDEVIAQLATLVFAAMDTTSGALAHILHLLAERPEVQGRLRQEIVDALRENDGEPLSYDRLSELPYLEAVCRETLRLCPPVTSIVRTTRSDAVLPLGTPIRGRDGKLMHEILVPAKTEIMVGVLASNRNPALWGPDSDEWKPERWLSPLPDAIKNAHLPGIYSNLMTFFGGGRGCIGFKFSQMEMKVVLSTLIQSFEFSIPPELKAPIVWNLAGLQHPTVGYESTKPELPLRVSPL